ncbi:hypothetical protein J6590_075618 [Homalodisca vitripennis]|nr:hypothetical protein J6590_075618 [Homalodisca vitripennis]
MQYTNKEKVKTAELIVKMLSKKEQPTNRTSGLSPVTEEQGMRVIEQDMDLVIYNYMDDSSEYDSWCCCIQEKISRPQLSDLNSDKLTFQKDYNDAFAQLTQDFKAKGLKKLFCSPMGCVRDMIPPENFAKNIVIFHQETGASVSQRELRRGLSHQEFMLKLKESIEDGICNLSSAGGQDMECQDVSVPVDSPPTSTQTPVDEKEDGAIDLKNEPPKKI